MQVFLTVGGAMKMIPSTGVTLPFISYGGSSIMSTVIMFAIVQGFYLSRREERGGVPRPGNTDITTNMEIFTRGRTATLLTGM